ncbi:MAG: LuxR C-terminal-related transcriptional regulator [Thermomicrobiales bacterium]
MIDGIAPVPDTGIVSTKLSPPRLHRDHVPRSDLVARLENGGDRPLTLVCAPAGSGKSTLLREWLDVSGLPFGWIALDERDSDFGVFLSYLLTVLRTAFPTLPFATRDLVRALTLPPPEILAGSLANDLQRLPNDFILVLDDYHVITNPQIHHLLELLLSHPPARLHLVVATRAEPPWALPQMRARGQVSELRFSELQFTRVESEQFLRHSLGDAIAPDVITILHEESEGWAAGLQLMALAIDRRDPVSVRSTRLAAANEDIRTFLWDEVLSKQPLEVQNRLLAISILSRFSASLCESVYAPHGSQEVCEGWGRNFLSDLLHANLFVIPLDGSHEFFRFHHLFQQFLVERRKERFTAAEIAALHQRASAWFESHDFIEDALDHALAAGDATGAADIIGRHRMELYNRDQFARLRRWLGQIPPEVKNHHPELLLAEARIASLNWRFTESAVLLDHAERELAHGSLDPAANDTATGELLVLRAIIGFWTGDAQTVVNNATRALELLPADASHLRGNAHTGIATGYYLDGDLGRALGYIEERLSETPSLSPAYAWLLQTDAFFRWLQGDWTNLALTGFRLLRVSEELELSDQQALAHYFLGTVHYMRNELDLAEEHLAKAFNARFVLRLMWWAQAAAMVSLTYQAQERPKEARQVVEDAQTFILERHAMRVLPAVGAALAEIERRQGAVAAAVARARQVDPGPLTWALAAIEPRIAQARALLWLDDDSGLDQTAALLAELREFCDRLPNRRLACEVEALSALLQDRRGEREQALATVQCLVREVAPDGWVRLFADLGEPMERLLRQLAAQGVERHAVTALLPAFPQRSTGAHLPDQSFLPEALTDRELEVLSLLYSRNSNKEIAADLFIAPGTVKRHTLSIYRKLDVADRRAAVEKAVELGLLSAR